MFHRVKSEGQDDEQQTTPATSAQEEKAESSTQDNKPAETEPTSQGQTSEQTSNTQDQKDEPTMSEAEKTQTQEPTPATTYQRPAAAVRTTGGYPGAYPGAAAVASDSASASDRRLTIGPGITMSGEIESCDYLLVEGTVEAALKGANVLEIAESGVFYGTVEINEANIAGRFEGDITVNGRLTIASGGAVTGSIAYKEIEIEAGATVDGKLTPLAAAPAAAAPKPAQKAAPKAASAKNEKAAPEPANNDGELFSKAVSAAE